tara:strand:- start:1982 stop:2170 length:189 start_codon:yes stop_codon:yes gene_type:complete
MKEYNEGDLVYSYTSKEFYIVLSYEGMLFTVYTMDGEIKFILDVSLVHIDDINEASTINVKQ